MKRKHHLDNTMEYKLMENWSGTYRDSTTKQKFLHNNTLSETKD